jgi:hypothetical protein
MDVIKKNSLSDTMWAAHWHCVIDEVTWSSTWVFNSFKSDNALVINAFLASRSLDESTGFTLIE